ncbi:sugar phosphate nucleotidyltransferase [Nocardia goodfellowii]
MLKPESLQGILLLGGSGTRLRPTYSGNKHLLRVGGRAMASYGIELLHMCGIDTVTAVVGPEDQDHFERLFDSVTPELNVRYVVQPHPAGTADALERCLDTIDRRYVATLWGDNLFEYVPAAIVARYLEDPTPGLITVAESSEPRQFSTVEITGGRVATILDKPAAPTVSTVCAGLMLFDSAALFRALHVVGFNHRGEREAMDAVRALNSAGRLSYDRLTGKWFDAAVSPAFLREAELFALRSGFNNPDPTLENSSWTSLNRLRQHASFSTSRGAAN